MPKLPFQIDSLTDEDLLDITSQVLDEYLSRCKPAKESESDTISASELAELIGDTASGETWTAFKEAVNSY